MTYRSLCIGAFAILSSASRANADTASQPRKPPAVPNDAVSAPAIDQEARRAFREIVKRDLAEPTVAKALKGYSISPTLTQLRRYIEPGTGETRTVCIVDLALSNAEHSLVATVRGTSAATREPRANVVEAAVHSAVARLPEAVRSVEKSRGLQARR